MQKNCFVQLLPYGFFSISLIKMGQLRLTKRQLIVNYCCKGCCSLIIKLLRESELEGSCVVKNGQA